MLHNVTASILNLILDVLGEFFCFLFYINDYCVVNLLPVIYYYFFIVFVQCSFWAFCVLSPWRSLSVTLSIHTYLYICIFHCGEKPIAWTVAGSSSLDQKTLSLLCFCFDFSVCPLC